MIERLEMFIALAHERHFGRAAQACGITQPSLSNAMRQLEEHLGVQLILRGSRFQGLTPEGERVLDWARRITGDARAMKDEMRAARKGLSGTLTIGVIPTALPRVARLTAPFAKRHSGVTLRLLSATSTEILAGIGDHRMDAGLSYLGNEPLGRLEALPLYEERYVLLSAKKTALPKPLTWEGLSGLRLCLLTSDMQNRRIINQLLDQAGVAATAALESNSVLALVAHVATGDWVSILPEALAELVTAPGHLHATPLPSPARPPTVGLVFPPRDLHRPALDAFLKLLRNQGSSAANTWPRQT